jgi:hypothetical protein
MRKNAAMLKSSPVKIGTIDKAFIAKLAKQKPVPGCEEQWKRYLDACQVEAEAYARYDAIFRQVEKEGGSSSCASWPAFVQLGHEWQVKSRAAMGALDTYEYAVKHRDDDVPVAEDDLREVVAASMEDNMDGLQITLKSSGLLAAKVAQAIRHNVIELEFTDIPYCQDHNHN